MSEQYITSNGIRLAYESFGDAAAPPIILVMGLGTQLIAWPLSLCEGLAAEGFRVIRFDNRDIGLSEKMENAHIPQAASLLLRSTLKLPLRVPYTLEDMTQDLIGLLDALAIDQAHLVGASMGGTPTLVIHGRDDTLVPVAGGIDTARHIPHARLELFDGMGHDLPQQLLPVFTDLIAAHARDSARSPAGPFAPAGEARAELHQA